MSRPAKKQVNFLATISDLELLIREFRRSVLSGG